MDKARVVIVGAGGYTGAELVEILLRHPRARIVGLFGSEARAGKDGGGSDFGDIFPRFRGRFAVPVLPADVAAIADLKPDAVFLATPHEVSVTLAAALLDRGCTIFDLSAAFRLRDAAMYDKFYGFHHERPDLLEKAVYGLPEFNREQVKHASLIAVPGCYPTSAILALRPLVKAGAVRPGTRVIVDSISGVSGAGRSPAVKSLFCEVSVQPYGVLTHRHTPEIAEHSGTPVIFTPHLGPYDRGIVSTMHVELAAGGNAARVAETYAATYAHEPFVRLLASGQWPSVNGVKGTNFCDMAWAVDENDAARANNAHLIVCTAIDNLVKGAAGQAIQCMNIRLGLPETLALGAEARETSAVR